MNLSTNAQQLQKILNQTGGGWMGNIMDILFTKPVYASNPEAQKSYWQWEANAYGNGCSRPVNGESVEFTKNIEVDYSPQLSAAYQELRKAGLANERNNGYNEYWIYPTKK
jgi:hypothetical protein